MRLRRTVAAAVIGLAASGCGDDGTDGGAGGGDANDVAATGDASTGPDFATGSAGDGGSSSDVSSVGVVTATVGSGSSGVGGGDPSDCLGGSLLHELGSDRLMIGASLGDGLATTTPLDVRYIQLSGALPDGAGPCGACDESCRAEGVSCSNVGEPCGWWGCQENEAPGSDVRIFAEETRARGQIPMVTYYVVLHSSGGVKGTGELEALNDPVYLARYLADFRFMLQQLGEGPALVHVEPELWAYAQQSDSDPHAIPTAVPEAAPVDCGAEEATFAGLGRCLVTMARIHAPGAKIGLHGSGWATGSDVLLNTDPDRDVAGAGMSVGYFLAATAPDADLVFVDATDRDAGFDAETGDATWWDETNGTLPNFHQAFTWSSALSEATQRPHLWWRVPFGNEALSGDAGQWNDNRLDYFFAHMSEVAAAHGVGVAFGAGAEGQVTAETDGNNFVDKASSYAASGGQPLCALSSP